MHTVAGGCILNAFHNYVVKFENIFFQNKYHDGNIGHTVL